jgi:hypothetical protein
MAAKFFTGLPQGGPDPECVKGHADAALFDVVKGTVPKPSLDHSYRVRVIPGAAAIRHLPMRRPARARACDDSPLASLASPAP